MDSAIVFLGCSHTSKNNICCGELSIKGDKWCSAASSPAHKSTAMPTSAHSSVLHFVSTAARCLLLPPCLLPLPCSACLLLHAPITAPPALHRLPFLGSSGKSGFGPQVPPPHQSAPSALPFLSALRSPPRTPAGCSQARQHQAPRHLGCTCSQAAAAGGPAPSVRHGSARHANQGARWCATLCRPPYGVRRTDYLKVRPLS